MFEDLVSLVGSLRDAASSIEHASLSGDDAVSLVSLFTEIERIGSAGRMLAVRRVEQSKI